MARNRMHDFMDRIKNRTASSVLTSLLYNFEFLRKSAVIKA